jgi:hypothetical protein
MSELEIEEVVCDIADSDAERTSERGAQPRTALRPIYGVRVGILIGMRDDGRTPLIVYSGQPDSAALPARAIVDLHGAHIGRDVVLMFEDGDPRRPLVMGCLSHQHAPPVAEGPGNVEVDADGERLLVSAKEQLVLRCGKASITLTKAGKVLIQGTYLSSRSSGVHRVVGGSVKIN